MLANTDGYVLPMLHLRNVGVRPNKYSVLMISWTYMDMDIDMDMVMTVLMSDQVLLRLVLASSSLAPKTLNWPSRRYYIDGDSTNVRSVVVDVDDFSSTL